LIATDIAPPSRILRWLIALRVFLTVSSPIFPVLTGVRLVTTEAFTI
jgi:hypothetical protein